MLKFITILLLLPLTVVQGLWLKFRATRLPGATGERSGTFGEGEALHVLAIGDSIIDGVGADSMSCSLPVQFALALAGRMHQQVNWQVEGESGLAISQLLQKLDDLVTEKADFILISIGVNDVTGLSSTRHWRWGVNQLLDRLQHRWPGACILFTGIPPMEKFPLPPQPLRFTLGARASVLDSIAAQICSTRPNVLHVPTRIDSEFHDFCDDGYHPSGESCESWANELARIAAA